MPKATTIEPSNHFSPIDYWDLGLSVFPVQVGGGVVRPPDKWQSWCHNIPPVPLRDSWLRGPLFPDSISAVGLATGKVFGIHHRLVCLDIDHPGLVRCLTYLFPSPSGRFGSKGVGLFYRVAKEVDDLKKSHNYIVPGRGSPAVEYLSSGRFTFIPPSVHRKTGKPYQWVGRPLVNVLDQLPELTVKDLKVIQAIATLDVDGATIDNLTTGESTHHPTLALVARLVAFGLDPERIVNAVTLLFPATYKGDTLRQIPEMVNSAFKKGFDKKSEKPSDPDLSDDDLSDIFSDWHYVTNINRMVNSADKVILDKDRFDSVMANRIRRAMNIYVQWPGRSIKSKVTYLPGQPAVMQDAVNMWRPTELNPKDGDVKPWLDHIALYYTGAEVTHMLDWMAHCLQRPGVKPGHALLMGSKYEGVGKDLWLVPVRAAFGSHNVSEVGADSLTSSFNEWLAHKHLIIIQEVWTGARRELSNQLKPLLSSPPDQIMVNEKNVSRYPVPNICATIMLTNHKDAVSMAAEDRRYFVTWTENPPQDATYYKGFADWVTDPENQGYVYDFLLRRDLVHFNIKSIPPKTIAKEEMTDATMTKSENLVVVVRDILHEMDLKEAVASGPLYDQLRVVAPDIAREVVKVPISSPRYPIRMALKMLGYETLDQKGIRKVAGKVRFVTVYARAERKEEFEKMRPVDLFDMVINPVEY